ncbi:MAG: hypothetical protein ACP5O7_12140 [Phycisphaerae bacterium]
MAAILGNDYGFYALLCALICLLPPVLYLLGVIRDPFHPLIIVGGTAFGCASYLLLTDPAPALQYTTMAALSMYQFIVATSILSLYTGWWWLGRRSHAPSAGVLNLRPAYSPHRMAFAAWVYAIISAAVAVRYYGHIRASGYITNLVFLEWPAAILFIQAALLDRTLVPMAVVGVPVACTESLLRFFLYGSRFEVAVVSSLAMVPFLLRGKRPRKPFFLGVLLAFAVVVWSMTATRTIMGQGKADNRLTALGIAIEHVLGRKHPWYTAGKTFVFGTNVVRVASETHFDNGMFLYNLGIRFLPHEWFPNKYNWYTDWSQTGDITMVRRHLGMSTDAMPNGAACSGFASVFVEFGWLYVVPWFFLGAGLAAVYRRAVHGRLVEFQGLLVISYVLMFLFIGQDVYQFVLYGLFGGVPTVLGYWFARTGVGTAAFPPGANSRRAEPLGGGGGLGG